MKEREQEKKVFWETPEGLEKIGTSPCHYKYYWEYVAIYEDSDERDEVDVTKKHFSPEKIEMIARILNQHGVEMDENIQSEYNRRHIPYMEGFGYYNHYIWKFDAGVLTIKFKIVSDRDKPKREIFINEEKIKMAKWPD